MNETKKRVAFTTLGCKLNYAETSTIARKFEEEGYQRVPFNANADIVVINTCSVTQAADKKCRQAISKAIHRSPNALVAVVGCYSQLKAEEIAAIPGVGMVLGTREKFNIIDHIQHQSEDQPVMIHSCGIEQVSEYNASYSMADRTRAFLKVQDGCDYQCSYCTIPLARGASRNQKVSETIQLAREIVRSGAREIVLTGVNIGDFGRTTGESFYDLIRALDNIDEVDRFRISSIEPNLLSDEIIRFVATSKRFAPHFHIPLQSGCNEILGKMKRRYRRELFADRILSIRTSMPLACIGVDVIAGFPGETEELFMDTYQFLNDLPISYLHAFTFSERKDTVAASLPGKVSHELKESRTHRLIDLSEQKRLRFYEQNIGTEGSVIFESARKDGNMFGFTGNYIRVETPYQKELINRLDTVKLKSVAQSGNMSIEF